MIPGPPSAHGRFALRLEDVGVTYPGGLVALQAVTLIFQRGEFAVLLGLSGAGKSTLLRTLNFLVRPTRGRLISPEFGELGPAGALRAHRRRTAIVFQHHQLLERHTALANVLTGRLGYHGTLRSLWPLPRADQELAYHCLERVGLAEKALVRVDQLSGGQKQRVGIARALAQQPTILLADEPVASLDPATSGAILGLLHRICQEDGITVIVSLHQLEHARRFADRIVGLAHTRVVFDGAATALDDGLLSQIYAAPAMQRSSPPRPEAVPFFRRTATPDMEISL
jgi:phosphonate transport system ATP-binding protein